MQNRRQFLIAATTAASASLLSRTVSAQEKKRTRIILLGTKGGPTLTTRTSRTNPATLIVVNDVPYLIDCGYGVSRQLISAGIAPHPLPHIFITQHHSDHKLQYWPLLFHTPVNSQPNKIHVYRPTRF